MKHHRSRKKNLAILFKRARRALHIFHELSREYYPGKFHFFSDHFLVDFHAKSDIFDRWLCLQVPFLLSVIDLDEQPSHPQSLDWQWGRQSNLFLFTQIVIVCET
jgi:hypothetical protein